MFIQYCDTVLKKKQQGANPMNVCCKHTFSAGTNQHLHSLNIYIYLTNHKILNMYLKFKKKIKHTDTLSLAFAKIQPLELQQQHQPNE